MAQASSAQREPSMEEILASIRRIIEDGESGRKEVPAGEGKSAQIENFPMGMKQAGENTAIGKEAPASESKAPASALDRLRSSFLDEDLRADHDHPMEDDFVRKEDDLNEHVVPAAAVANDEGLEHGRAATPLRLQPVSTDLNSDKAGGHQIADAAPVSEWQPAAQPDHRPILSEQSGRKIAAAFGELTEALEESRRQSLDQIAEEMLRPMLQDWLDNHLPQLVERLVREEIERIARGV